MNHVLRAVLCLFLCTACGAGVSAMDEPAEVDEPDEPASRARTHEEGTETAAAAAARASGRNFSIPVPADYRQVTSGTIADMMRDEVLTPGGVILMAEASSAPDAAPGSVVVSPTAMDVSSDTVDENLCSQLAEIVAGQHEASVERSGMVELPWGRTCQWALRVGGHANRLRLGTVFAAHAQDWVVTCNYDERDEPASAACNQVLSGWAFAP